MKRRPFILFALLTSASLVSCKHDKEPNKIIDALPIHLNETCPPAQATQAWFALKRDCLSTIIPVINRIGITGFTFPEVTPVGGMEYTFSREDRHYGTAHVTIQFRDSNNAPVDPITNPTLVSTTTLQSVAISVSGDFAGFNYNESLTLTLDVAGNTTGTKHLTGTSNFNGSSYALTYTFATGGSNSTFEGMTDGSVNATGTGPSGAPATISMSFYPEHTANGTVAWEGNNGSLHLDNSASGLLITSQYRLPLD